MRLNLIFLPLSAAALDAEILAAKAFGSVTDQIGSFDVNQLMEQRRLESLSPSAVTSQPSLAPSLVPSAAPSDSPSVSAAPSVSPSLEPTMVPSSSPSQRPSAVPTQTSAPVSVRQFGALQSFADSVGVAESRLDNWFSDGTAYCDFEGVTCDNEGYVIFLDLDEMALSGTLPMTMGEFTRLRRLKALKNDIEGTLPSSLLLLPDLRQLNLGRNKLTGPLPEVPDMFPMLRRLHLHSNNLTGTVPSLLCSIRDMDALDISDNAEIYGELPNCFGEMQLTNFRIQDIGLTGEVPVGMCVETELNGVSPNTYGCDVIACPAGYYEPTEGRQISDEKPCLECEVFSNVVGSTVCQELDGNEVVIREPTSSPAPSLAPSLSPTGAPSITPVPSQSPSFQPSSFSPSSSPSVSLLPSVSSSPSSAPSITPSAIPSSQPSSVPSAVPTVVPSSSPTISPSAAPSPSPSQGSNASGATGDNHSNGSSEKFNKWLLIGPLVTFFAVLCILAFFLFRRQRRRREEVAISEAVYDDEAGSPNAPPMSMADSVSYLYDLEDGNTTDGASRMSENFDDMTEGGEGNVGMEQMLGGFEGVNLATVPVNEESQPVVNAEDEETKDVSLDLHHASLLSPTEIVPRTQRLTRNRSNSKLTKVYPMQTSKSVGASASSNPWLDQGTTPKENIPSDLKLQVYGSLLQSTLQSCASGEASMRSYSSRASDAPMLGNHKDTSAFMKSDDCSDTVSEASSLDEQLMLGPACNGWTLGGIREKFRLKRSESF